jgi:hypothetical protein
MLVGGLWGAASNPVAAGQATRAQDVLPTMRYFPSGVGDHWQYRNLVSDGESPLVLRVQEATWNGQRVAQRVESHGDFRYQTVTPDQGLVVHHLAFRGGPTIDYERPVTLLPPDMRVGDRYTSETPYVSREGDRVTAKGRQTYEVTIEAREEVETPAGLFSDALRTRTIALRTDEDGTQMGYEMVEWLAPDIGPVRVTGRLYWNDAGGRRTRLFRVDAVLETARVAGKTWMAAETPRQDSERAMAVARAHRAFGAFKDGLATGRWQAFLDLLTDDFTLTFPTGKYLGQHTGKATAAEFFAYVSQVYPEGLFASLDRLTVDGSRALFEFRSEGMLVLPTERRPYRNRVAVAMEFHGDKVARYREYFGSDGKSY